MANSEVQQVPACLTVIEDNGEFIIQASKPVGKRLGALVLSSLNGASRVTYCDELGVKVFRANGHMAPAAPLNSVPRETIPAAEPAPQPVSRRIVQDGNAPPAVELVEEEWEQELKRQEAEASQMAKSEQFNHQNALPAVEEPEPEKPRKREPRQLATVGAPCGRCNGAGQVIGDAGFQGACPVCQGKGQIVSWGRGRRAAK